MNTTPVTTNTRFWSYNTIPFVVKLEYAQYEINTLLIRRKIQFSTGVYFKKVYYIFLLYKERIIFSYIHLATF